MAVARRAASLSPHVAFRVACVRSIASGSSLHALHARPPFARRDRGLRGSAGSGGGTPSSGGTTGNASGGSAGSATGGSGGAAGSAGTGGNAGTGGSADAAGGARPADARAADGPGRRDGGSDAARASDGGGQDDIGGEPVPGKAWLRLCPRADSQMACCELLCRCLPSRCSDVPQDQPRIPGCMAMCLALSDFRARCQVYHCFESKNPGATRDHGSHCGHASGRVGGGSCDIITRQLAQ